MQSFSSAEKQYIAALINCSDPATHHAKIPDEYIENTVTLILHGSGTFTSGAGGIFAVTMHANYGNSGMPLCYITSNAGGTGAYDTTTFLNPDNYTAVNALVGDRRTLAMMMKITAISNDDTISGIVRAGNRVGDWDSTSNTSEYARIYFIGPTWSTDANALTSLQEYKEYSCKQGAYVRWDPSDRQEFTMHGKGTGLESNNIINFPAFHVAGAPSQSFRIEHWSLMEYAPSLNEILWSGSAPSPAGNKLAYCRAFAENYPKCWSGNTPPSFQQIYADLAANISGDFIDKLSPQAREGTLKFAAEAVQYGLGKFAPILDKPPVIPRDQFKLLSAQEQAEVKKRYAEWKANAAALGLAPARKAISKKKKVSKKKKKASPKKKSSARKRSNWIPYPLYMMMKAQQMGLGGSPPNMPIY